MVIRKQRKYTGPTHRIASREAERLSAIMSISHGEGSAMKTLILNVNGMICENCVEHVRRSLSLINGVRDVDVDLMGRRACVRHDENLCTPHDLVVGIQRAGYQVDGVESVDA